jgi:hypothetical protein
MRISTNEEEPDLWYFIAMNRPRTRSSKRVTKAYTLGRRSFAKISAVEGIEITLAMDEDFQEFERKGLSAAERRRIISGKYGKVR